MLHVDGRAGWNTRTNTHTCTYVNVIERCVVQLTDPIDAPQVERLRKQQQAERDNQEVIQAQRMDSLKSHYESCIQGEENSVMNFFRIAQIWFLDGCRGSPLPQ